MSNLSKKAQALLEKIIEATKGTEGLLYVDEKAVAALVSAGLVEINPDMRDGADNVAARATSAAMEPQPMTTPATVTNTAPSSFTIASVPIPAAKRGGRTGGKYPFDLLEVGQSFFVPDPKKADGTPELDKDGNPVRMAKALASTVTSANERYAEEIPGETRTNRKGKVVPATKQIREFTIRSVEDGAAWGSTGVKGAAIFRTL